MTTLQIQMIIDNVYTILLIWVLKDYFFALLEVVDRLAHTKPKQRREYTHKPTNVTSINQRR